MGKQLGRKLEQPWGAMEGLESEVKIEALGGALLPTFPLPGNGLGTQAGSPTSRDHSLKQRLPADSAEQGSLSTGEHRGDVGDQQFVLWFCKPSPIAEEVSVPLPGQQHFLLEQKQVAWAWSLNFFTHKMKGMLPQPLTK